VIVIDKWHLKDGKVSHFADPMPSRDFARAKLASHGDTIESFWITYNTMDVLAFRTLSGSVVWRIRDTENTPYVPTFPSTLA
jgi:hypothetical protein